MQLHQVPATDELQLWKKLKSQFGSITHEHFDSISTHDEELK